MHSWHCLFFHLNSNENDMHSIKLHASLEKPQTIPMLISSSKPQVAA
jgi:hypothetical protein